MYLKYFYQILLNWLWKYKMQNTFFPNVFQIQNTCGPSTAFLSTVENVITVVVHSVKHSSEHTTQSLQFCYKPVKQWNT